MIMYEVRKFILISYAIVFLLLSVFFVPWMRCDKNEKGCIQHGYFSIFAFKDRRYCLPIERLMPSICYKVKIDIVSLLLELLAITVIAGVAFIVVGDRKLDFKRALKRLFGAKNEGGVVEFFCYLLMMGGLFLGAHITGGFNTNGTTGREFLAFLVILATTVAVSVLIVVLLGDVHKK